MKNKVVTVNEDNFEQEVIQSQIPVLVDFWATWCGPCKTLLPILGELAREGSNYKICKVNVDENPNLTTQYKIMSVPTVIIFNQGELVDKFTSIQTKDTYKGFLSSY